MAEQQTVVPLVSSGTAGPLGAIHLPRLWLKLSLAARGALDTTSAAPVSTR
jgi:hypothetical protein